MALTELCYKISFFFFLFIVKQIWNVLYTFWIGPSRNKIDIRSYGQWALVTGCTDGIGKEYARQLADRGCDIILVSRSLDKLKKVASEIEKDYNVQTKVIQIDFTGDESIYDKLEKEIQGLEIGTLVNNVGLAYPYLEYFLDLPDWKKLMRDLVNVNVVSTIRVTGLVLPEMVKRGKGIVINLGSASANLQSPLLVVYSAAKAFVVKFTDGLRYEYANKGIIIQCLSPSLIATNMTGVESPNFVVPPPEKYVASALSLLGSTHRSTGYFPHSCLMWVYKTVEFLSEDFGAWACRTASEFGQVLMLKQQGRIKTQ
ncbi:very-long-chain 3-oxoacyl-CoA reductase-like [Plodia interpunctella]|uniref:very-long-chain 3-oxoacyl-CoA reductase-like n=1 Tax=Plodia interpunctella TaxID=58824 RepID=UPI0023676762|nr:very-long-chain 3-oxoacyl-CoA reductase-like [Plodia interpunctella]